MKVKINKKEIEFFLKSIRIREAADDLPFSDNELIDELITYIESNPHTIIIILPDKEAGDKT